MKNKLRQIITDYGLKIIEEPKRLEAIINDLLINESKSDLFAIKFPLQQGLVLELKSRGKDFIPMFKYKLINDFCMTEEKAIFTVEVWAYVLFNETITIKTDKNIEEINNKKKSIKNNLNEISVSDKNDKVLKDITDKKSIWETIKNIIIPETNNINKVNQSVTQIIIPKNDFEPEMIYVEGGTFMMGNNDGDEDEKPVHKVTLNSFYIGKYQITQKQWKSVMSNNPSRFEGDNLPIECVSWNYVQEFIKKLNQKTGKKYRLPTEAEWEYAARGGSKSKGYKYAGSNNLYEVAWYRANSERTTHPVGTKKPNELGIYDMTGNVWEWCEDWYDNNYYRNSPSINPKGPNSGNYRVLRGGSWNNKDSYYYSGLSDRHRLNPDNMGNRGGFRLVQD